MLLAIETYRPTEENRESRYKSSLYGQIIFNEDAKTTQWGKEQFSQQMVMGKLDNAHAKK